MNYHPEISFILDVLNEAEKHDFNFEQIRLVINQRADYTRVFLPTPYALSSVCLYAKVIPQLIEKEKTLEERAIALAEKRKKIKVQIQQVQRKVWWRFKRTKEEKKLKEILQQLNEERYLIMEEFSSPSGSPWERKVRGLVQVFVDVLKIPPPADAFENELYDQITQFYQKKVKQIHTFR